MTLRVLVSGQRSFGAAAAQTVLDGGHELAGVVAPYESEAGRPDRLRLLAERLDVPLADRLSVAAMPPGVDVILAAHSHAFVGRKSRGAARLASVGYHPSLLPLHRGRDAVRWAARDGDRVVGGSVYHLTDAVDGGPLAAQDYAIVRPGLTAEALWRDVLFPMGLRLITAVLADLAAGLVVSVDQDEAAATWEPSWERPPLFRPELPELAAAAGGRLSWTADPHALRRPHG